MTFNTDDVSRQLNSLPFGTFHPMSFVMDCIPSTTYPCLYSMDIWVNEGFQAALAASDVPLGRDTEFDWMMHSSLLKIGDDDYNA